MYSLDREVFKGLIFERVPVRNSKKSLKIIKMWAKYLFLSWAWSLKGDRKKCVIKWQSCYQEVAIKKHPESVKIKILKMSPWSRKVNLFLKSCLDQKTALTKIKVAIILKKMILDLWKCALMILIKSTKPSFLPLHPFI